MTEETYFFFILVCINPLSRKRQPPLERWAALALRALACLRWFSLTTSRLRRTPPIHFVAGGELWFGSSL